MRRGMMFVAVWGLLGASACGRNDLVADVTRLADEACACKEWTCIENVNDRFEGLVEKYGDNAAPSADVQEKVFAEVARLNDCAARIQMRAASADPSN